jgi:tetratricopeptide (TPR) repeat protein
VVSPERPIPHQLEDESRTAFESLKPSRHVFRTEHSDYGIDGELEQFDEANQATGRRFRVQLKATAQTGAAAMRERISLDKAAYYRAQELPVLMVRYVASTGWLYGRWFHRFDPYDEHVGDTHLTFHWSEDDKLEEASFDRLFGEVERITRLKGIGSHLPLTVAIETPADGAHGCTHAEIELAVEAAVAWCAGVLVLAEGDTQADVTVAIGGDEIRADVGGFKSVTFHVSDDVYTADEPAQAIAADALTCVAAALGNAGQGDAGARIAVHFLADSLVSGILPIAAQLGAAMVHAGRVVEVVDLAERLDQGGEEDRETCGGVFMELVRQRTESLQPHEAERFEAALRDRLQRRLDAGRDGDAAASAQNVGFYFLTVRRPRDAVPFLEQAMALDPSRETADLANALAGAYFLSDRYAEAVPAYDRALELGGPDDPSLQARRADALLYVGRYRQALDSFNAIETDDSELSAWIYVKYRALTWVIWATGIEEQNPDPEAANEVAGRFSEIESDEDADELAERVWELHAVSPLGWFNHARVLLDRGREEDAMHAYLTAAVMRERDVEAWVNVAVLAAKLDNGSVFNSSVITGNRLNQDLYMAQFARHLRKTVSEAAVREQVLRGVRETIESARGRRTDAEHDTDRNTKLNRDADRDTDRGRRSAIARIGRRISALRLRVPR